MIIAQNLTKKYGDKVAVDGLSLTVRPGIVTGFLGPNGAGKSTTMRMILGLDAPTSGRITVNGKPFADHDRPMHEVGALLEARAIHTGRSARNHLLAMAATAGIGRQRVEVVIDMVGLTDVAGKRAGPVSDKPCSLASRTSSTAARASPDCSACSSPPHRSVSLS